MSEPNKYERACEAYAAAMVEAGYDYAPEAQEWEAHTQAIAAAVDASAMAEPNFRDREISNRVRDAVDAEDWPRLRDIIAAYRTEIGANHAVEIERLKRALLAAEKQGSEWAKRAADAEVEVDRIKRELNEARNTIHQIARAAGCVEYGDTAGYYSQAEDDEIVEAVRCHRASHAELIELESKERGR